MASDESLKRLGGGRWETRDGRFAIEPQSGTWVVVDNAQTDDLGLPLVRGPFGSLTAAKDAIEGVRTSGPAESPLADRLKQATAGTDAKSRTEPAAADGRAATKGSRKAAEGSTAAPEARTPAPEEPPEPRWLRELEPADRRRARELIERLGKLDIEDAEEIVRSEIARNLPALARLGIERAIGAAVARSRSPEGAARATIDAILAGRDKELGVRWRLVDEQGRIVDNLDLPT